VLHVACLRTISIEVGDQRRISQHGEATCALDRVSADTAGVRKQNDAGRQLDRTLGIDQDALQADLAVVVVERLGFDVSEVA
jgi:hypothetical protein